MTHQNLAQLNTRVSRTPTEAPEITDFAINLDPINALAERQTGFVWRLTGEGNNATDIRVFDNPLQAITMSVWTGGLARSLRLSNLTPGVYETARRVVRDDRGFHRPLADSRRPQAHAY